MVNNALPVLSEFEGVPSQYQPGTHWVPDSSYQGGGYYSNETGQHYSYAQLEKLWTEAGGPANAAPQMAYIAEYDESGGYAGAWNSTGATGLWQVEWPSNYSGNRTDLFDPATNAQAAVSLYQQSGFTPWGNDRRLNLHIPASTSVPGVSAGSSPQQTATDTSATSSLLGSLFGLSDWQDLAERLGLILLGSLLILLGIFILTGKSAMKLVLPEARAANAAKP